MGLVKMKPIAQSDPIGFNLGTCLVDACKHPKYKMKNKSSRAVMYFMIFAFVLSGHKLVFTLFSANLPKAGLLSSL